MKKPLILVTGATGFVGREAVAQLVDAHHPVRALVRDPAKAKSLGEAGEVIGEMMQKMSAAIGKPLQHVDVPVATAREGMIGAGYPPEQADACSSTSPLSRPERCPFSRRSSNYWVVRVHSFDRYLRANAATLNT
jgi:NAD(P)-dependent dehydrogenase (short-subunit alcohol dehydrogenase family)